MDANEDNSEVDTIESHLAECETCRQLVDLITGDPELESKLHRANDFDAQPLSSELVRRLAAILPDGLKTDEPEPTKDANEQPERIGSLKILDCAGAGGMGVVYKAHDEQLDRIVAVKILSPDLSTSERQRQRFLREAKQIAHVDHPNVVKIHRIDDSDVEQPFIEMEWIEGATLQEWLKVERRGWDELAQMLRQIAWGLAAAHAKHIVHRDIKPQNILCEDKAGRVCITDFGIAKQAEDRDVTKSGVILGTPAYMSPEQIESPQDVNDKSDLFSFGVVAYYTLTGKLPFQGPTDHAIVTAVLEQEPIPPRQINPRVPRDLETICLKCLEKDPKDRLRSAELIADELGLYLDGKPITCRPISRREKTWRWCRRNPAIAGLASFSFVLLTSFVIALSLKNADLAEERNRANSKSAEAEVERRAAVDQATRTAEVLRAIHAIATSTGDELPRSSDLEFDALNLSFNALRLLDLNRLDAKTADRLHAEVLISKADSLQSIGWLGKAIPANALASAQHLYEQADVYAENLAREAKSYNDARCLAIVSQRLADCYRKRGRLDEAKVQLDRMMEAAGRQFSGEKSQEQREDRLVALYKYSQLDLVLKRPQEAIDRMREAFDQGADQQVRPQIVSMCHGLLGDAYKATQDTPAALAEYMKCYDIRTEAHQLGDDSYHALHGLVAIADRIGDLKRKTGDRSGAREMFTECLDRAQELSKANPGSPHASRALANAHLNMGQLYLSGLDLAPAIAAFDASVHIMTMLTKLDPSDHDQLSLLAVTEFQLAMAMRGSFQYRDALGRLQKAEQTVGLISAAPAPNPQLARMATDMRGWIKSTERVILATTSPMPLEVQQDKSLLAIRGTEFAKQQKVNEALAALAMLEKEAESPTDLYSCACVYAVLARIGDRYDEFSTEAVRCLNRAVDAGWADARHTIRDRDLSAIREHPEFRRVVECLNRPASQ